MPLHFLWQGDWQLNYWARVVINYYTNSKKLGVPRFVLFHAAISEDDGWE